MSPTRIVALVLLAAGCSRSTTPPVATSVRTSAPAVSTPVTVAAHIAKPAQVDVSAATAVVGRLTDDVVAGRPDSTLLTSGFRTLLAGGAEAKADWEAEQYLKGLASGLSLGPVTTATVGPAVIGFTPPAGDGRRAAVRLVRVGTDWRVDWFHIGPTGPVIALTGSDLAQRFAIAAFLEPLLTGQYRLAEAALSPTARTKLAPPLGNDPLGYSRGILTNAFKTLAGGATGYAVTLNGSQASGELLSPGGAKRAFKLTLAETPDGWRVGDFESR